MKKRSMKEQSTRERSTRGKDKERQDRKEKSTTVVYHTLERRSKVAEKVWRRTQESSIGLLGISVGRTTLTGRRKKETDTTAMDIVFVRVRARTRAGNLTQ